jgi:hypothetical protein
MRRGLPIDDDPLLRYGLAACLLNRGDALIRLGDAGRMVDALAAFDEGIDVMRALPLTADARFPRRLAMACHNRGLALQAMGRPVAEPIAAFADALAILDDDQASGITDRPYLLAVVLTNLASARVLENTAESAARARDAARRAIALVEAVETGDAAAAEVGLKARHVLCHTIAVRLSAPAASDDPMPRMSTKRPIWLTKGSISFGSGRRRASHAFRAMALRPVPLRHGRLRDVSAAVSERIRARASRSESVVGRVRRQR